MSQRDPGRREANLQGAGNAGVRDEQSEGENVS